MVATGPDEMGQFMQIVHQTDKLLFVYWKTRKEKGRERESCSCI